jgi:hypothetical protein
VGACAGSGKGDPGGGGTVPLGGLGFFDFPLRGGGPAGRNSANTGLGSIVTEAAVVRSAGTRITCTGMVIGGNLFRVKVTVKPPSGAGTEIEHGVLQPGPSEVLASAPGGDDSSWTCTGGGVGRKASMENEEQPARLAPATAIAMTRRMINPSL